MNTLPSYTLVSGLPSYEDVIANECTCSSSNQMTNKEADGRVVFIV